MEVSSCGTNSARADQCPLLMERENGNDHEHRIDITGNDDSTTSSSADEQLPRADSLHHEDRVSSSVEATAHQPPLPADNRLNSRNSPFNRRGDGYNRRTRSPLNSGLWISVELVVTVGQIIAAIVVLSLAKDEHPKAPLFQWIVGYTTGCVATLPMLYWRFRTYNLVAEQGSSQSRGGSLQSNPQETTPYRAVSVTQGPEDEENPVTVEATGNNQAGTIFGTRFNGLVDHFKMSLDCFFAVWFVVGNVWIFGGHTSPSDAPKLYRLCIVFLTFSCIGYAMPFILCATICCCLPCLISVLGFRENFSQNRGATVESINALPTYKFRVRSGTDQEIPGENEGGFLVSGSEKKRSISGEDASCCICLAKYVDNDELRELPCLHVFHVDCVDKWLKINATCPLCKIEVGESSGP